MLTIRRATQQDNDRILDILKETDLYYPEAKLDSFWAAEEEGRIIGIAQFKEYKDYFFLSSLGVPKAYESKGIASMLVKELVKIAKKDVHLYTTLPSLFEKFGFEITSNNDGLPSKEFLQCEECEPHKCVAMVWRITT